MYYPKIEIKSKKYNDQPSVFTEVFIDGHAIHGVRSIKFENDATGDRVPTVTLDLHALDISIDSEICRLKHSGLGIKSIEFSED